MTAQTLLDVARGELGTKESPANSNRVKYNTVYYGREVSGSAYPWCCAFLWWVFQTAGAKKLFFGGKRTAYCPTLMSFHKKQWVTDYRPGDVIFFNFDGGTRAAHVGLCESWDGKRITTIDGNTGSGNEANGGAVMRRTRDKKYIVGAYRPAYKEELDLTEAQVKTIFNTELTAWLASMAAKPASVWSRMAEAKAAGITDGTRPGSFATREEVATMIMAAR